MSMHYKLYSVKDLHGKAHSGYEKVTVESQQKPETSKNTCGVKHYTKLYKIVFKLTEVLLFMGR